MVWGILVPVVYFWFIPCNDLARHLCKFVFVSAVLAGKPEY